MHASGKANATVIREQTSAVQIPPMLGDHTPIEDDILTRMSL